MAEEIYEKILNALLTSRRSLKSRELMKRAGIRSRDRFYQAIQDLKGQGKITVNKRHMVKAVEKPNPVKATIQSLSKGFAFARPEDGGEDLYIFAEDLRGAMVGDTVLLKNIRDTGRGPKAQVEKVTEKSRRTTTGTVYKENGSYVLLPDSAIRYNLPVDRGDTLRAKSGDKVLAELYCPKGKDKLYAKVVKIYGKAASARVCADAIIEQNGIPAVFPSEVLKEAGCVSAQRLTETDLKGRLDLRGMSICTIDGEDAKDLDDAIFVSRIKAGYRLGVHIADVSHYVKAGGAIDLEARRRGTSVYFADRVIPMLPKELSNGVCSLNPGEDKLTFSAILELDKQGNLLSWKFQKSVINSKVRGVYSEVNQLFAGNADASLRKKYAPVVRSLNAARELAEILREKFRAKGTINFESTESRFTLDEHGVCVDVRPRERGEAEQMIEQLMITANQAAARLARESKIPFIYRVHGDPDTKRVENLIRLVDALGFSTQRLKSGSPSTADFASILAQCQETPAQKVISHQLLRTMEKARYAPEPMGHFGLALEDYCHFTSPIRRYPDTAIHRILTDLTSKRDAAYLIRRYGAFVQEAAEESSRCEVRAMMAERSAEDCYMAEFMRAHIGECFDGVISGVTMRGIFVQLECSAEGFVPLDAFTDADYRFDGIITQVDQASGKKLTIGHALRVRVVGADVATGRIDFEPAE